MRPDKYQLFGNGILVWGAFSLRLVSFARLKEMRLDPTGMLEKSQGLAKL
jgi:hypothetical protein